MTKDDIIKLAREASHTYVIIRDDPANSSFTFDEDGLKRFANLVAAHKAEVALAEAYRCGYEAGVVAEREECAKWLDFYDGPNCRRAEAIRARGTP